MYLILKVMLVNHRICSFVLLFSVDPDQAVVSRSNSLGIRRYWVVLVDFVEY